MEKKILTLMMLLIIPAFSATCTEPPDVIPGYEGTRLNPEIQADVGIALAMINACIQGDREGMERYMHENFTLTGPGPESSTRQEQIEFWLAFASRNDNARVSNRLWYSWVVDETFSNQDFVGKWVVHWHDFSFRHIENGRVVTIPVHLAFKISDGQVVYVRHLYDQLSLYEQLGYRLLPPEPMEE